MMRLGTLFWLIVVSTMGFATFKVKYEVQDLEDELARTKKATAAEVQELHVLNAEWSYLNQPDRLAEMNRRYLSLVPIATKQLSRSIPDLPLRPPPPVPAEIPARAPEGGTALAATVPNAAGMPAIAAADPAVARPVSASAAPVGTAAGPAGATQAPAVPGPGPLAALTAPGGDAGPRGSDAARAAALKPAAMKGSGLKPSAPPRTLDDLLIQIGASRR